MSRDDTISREELDCARTDEYEVGRFQQHEKIFQEIVVEYPSISTYPEYKGKPYFSIKYTENGQEFIGYATYKPEVLSEFLKEYFMPSAQPQLWIPCSERLAEIGTYVLVSKKPLNFRSNLPNVCIAHRSRDPRSGKEEWNDMLFGKLDDDDVLAWMLLPEPYAERRTE